MTRPSLTSVYLYGLLVVLFGMVVHAPLSVFFGSLLPELAEPIKAWKEIVLTLLGVLAVILLTKRHLWAKFTKEWPVRIALGYILLHLALSALLGGELKTIVAGLMIDLRFIAFFLLAYAAVMLQPGMAKTFMRTVMIGAFVVLGFGILQITVLPDNVLKHIGYGHDTIRPFTTIDRNPDFVRINSTLRGPNPLGAICVLYGALIVAYLVRRWHGLAQNWRMIGVFGTAAVVAVLFASYSRSAYLAAALAGLVIVVGMAKRPSRKTLFAFGAAGVVGIASLLLLQSTDWYSNVILHEDPESTVVSKSNEEHVNSLVKGAGRVIRQPLGAGIGSTGSASLYDASTNNDIIIENWYLFVAHESGWLGLGLFMTLNVVVCISLWRLRSSWQALGLLASGLGLAAIGLLLPIWADETVALTWWGLAGGILGNGYAKRTRQ